MKIKIIIFCLLLQSCVPSYQEDRNLIREYYKLQSEKQGKDYASRQEIEWQQIQILNTLEKSNLKEAQALLQSWSETF